ncbi:MAG TPA: NB-ARC domain-containing protein [Anaerolineaceae bacterium]|nr:NB-ARC domain-containing protein [Anaerolineaceae bacterium]
MTLRTAASLTQAGLADVLGISRQAVVGWEAGSNYPHAKHLKHFITLCFQQKAFTPGHEADEIRTLWKAAHQKVLLDENWLAGLVGDLRSSAVPAAPAPKGETDTSGQAPARSVLAPRVDWGDALTVPTFYGREREMDLITLWVLEDHCQVVTLLGLGGIGKSALAVSLMHQLAEHFEVVIWRSLRDAPACEAFLDDCLHVLAPQQVGEAPASLERRIDLLMEHLVSQRVLLVIDNIETLLEDQVGTGHLRPGYEGYSKLLRRVAESNHQSCLLLTSREKPREFESQTGKLAPVRTLRLSGLETTACKQMLGEQGLTGTEQEQEELIERYGGNPLALKIVMQTIVELFGSEIAPFLEQGEMVFGGVRELLAEQFDRLSPAERSTLLWLAILREPVTLNELLAVQGLPLPRVQVLEALEALRRRSLIEPGKLPGRFTLQSVVLEYITAELVAEGVKEVEQRRLVHLIEHRLYLAQAKDYVRQAQERLLVAPLLAELRRAYPQRAELEQHLLTLLDQLRTWDMNAQGYGPANLVTLLRVLRGDLRGLNLARLVLRQVFLVTPAQEASLVGAHLSDCVLAEPMGAVMSIALSQDGRHLAAGTFEGAVRLWRVQDRQLIFVMERPVGPVWGLKISVDGQHMAIGWGDGRVSLCDVVNGKCLHMLTGHKAAVWSVAFSADGQRLVSGAVDGEMRLWDTASAECLKILTGHAGGVTNLAFSEDGKRLWSSGLDGTIRLWDTASAECLKILTGHAGAVTKLALSADGKRVWSSGFDSTIRVWDATRGECLQVLTGHSGEVVVALSADGQRLASGGGDFTVRLWDPASGDFKKVFTGHTGGVRGVALDADGQLLASGGWDGTVRLWDAEHGECLQVFTGYTTAIWSVALSRDGKRLATGGADAIARIWETSSGMCLQAFAHKGGVQGVALDAHGRWMVSAGMDGTVRLWDVASGECRMALAGHSVWGVALSADGQRLACSTHGTVEVWDSASGERLRVFSGHAGDVRGLALSADGQRVVSGGMDGTVRLWDVTSGECKKVFTGHSGAIWNATLSGDGQCVASCGTDATVRLWDIASGECVKVLTGHSDAIWDVELSSDGGLVASGAIDGTVRLWDATSGDCQQILTGHASSSWGVAMSGDGRLVADAALDGTVHLWDAHSGAQLLTLRPDRLYERMDITDLTGITEARRSALLALGAVDRRAGADIPERAYNGV